MTKEETKRAVHREQVAYNTGYRKAISTILARIRREYNDSPTGLLVGENLIRYALTMDTRYNAKCKKGPGK